MAEELKTIETVDTSPFKHLVMTLGELPTSFVDSMTYYECLAWLVNFIQNTVIPTVNNNAEAVEELQTAFTTLKNYVDNYFDNLDVQEEINNKLDQMVEDGQLTELIAQYLTLNAIMSFTNVASLKLAQNLVNGSTVETYGYHSVNDGGGSNYLIREITNHDIVDDMFILSVNNENLVAELITKDKISVKQLGAKGDNINDDTTAIQASLNKLNYAYLPKGNYKITQVLTVKTNGSIFGDNSNETTITSSTNCIKNEDVATNVNISVHDLTLAGDDNGSGIYLYRQTKNGDAYHNIYNLEIKNFEYGIYAYQYQNESNFRNINIHHCATGFYCYYLNDCYLVNIVCHNNTKDGLKITGSSELKIANVKCWYNGSDGVSYFNCNINASGAINIVNLSLQESYYHNLNISSCRMINISNIFLSWPGLSENSDIYQIVLDDSINCSISGSSQNGHFNQTGYTDYVLAVKSHPYNCKVNVTTEFDYPSNLKLYLIGANNNFNGVFNRNEFDISNSSLKYDHTNFAKNGDISNTTSLAFVNNNSHCSYENGNLRVDTSAESTSTNIYFQIATLPEADFYVSYMKFKKVQGSGNVVFESPGYANVPNDAVAGTIYYIAMAKYTDTTKQFITLTVPAGMIIDIIEFGIAKGETAKYNIPMNSKAIL